VEILYFRPLILDTSKNSHITFTLHSYLHVDSRRLSPLFREFLDTLEAIHTSEKMINHAKAAGGLVRKDAVRTAHPLVRIHPVTKEKCLFINGEFITNIIGLKEPERQVLMDFLLNHLITGHDFQARVRWGPKTIVMFDNRSTIRKHLP
jgi:sulfonate dioxygenase